MICYLPATPDNPTTGSSASMNNRKQPCPEYRGPFSNVNKLPLCPVIL